MILSDKERGILGRWATRRKSSLVRALRSRIVLEYGHGLDHKSVTARLKVTMPTAGKWRKRFIEKRLDRLRDETHPKVPRKISDADVERVVTQTPETTPTNATHWSIRSMAKASGLSQTAVSRIWRAFALQPHRNEAFKLTTDRQFVGKLRAIVGLYMSPPENAIVLCVDGKGRVQAVDRTQSLV